jgi:hypothetical protein
MDSDTLGCIGVCDGIAGSGCGNLSLVMPPQSKNTNPQICSERSYISGKAT